MSDELRAAANEIKASAEAWIGLHEGWGDEEWSECNCGDECLLPWWQKQVLVADAVLGQADKESS